MRKIYLFDFDGTLTSADTLLVFIRYACGIRRLLTGFMLFAPLLVLMKLRLYSNSRAKERLFAWYFRGMTEDDFDDTCRRFATSHAHLLRHRAVETLRKVFDEGATICVVSASIDNWVRPFFEPFMKDSRSELHVLGTQIACDVDGRLTGSFRSANCYGDEKVRRVLKELPDIAAHRSSYHIEAYGDSRGDREMLAFADNAHYRPFDSGDGHMGEIMRFAVVGILATAIQYALYWLLLRWLSPSPAMTIGYGVSFVFNFIASTHYTFRVKASAKKGAGFVFSHAVNYVLQITVLNAAILLGVPKEWAPIPMFAICVPVNFLLVRFFLKGKQSQKHKQ